MALEKLRTDYTDATFEGLRKYNEVKNEDGTVSFDDVTSYINKEKAYYTAKEVNDNNQKTNAAIAIVELLAEKMNNDYVIPEQVIEFTDKVCTISDEKVLSTSLVDVYFTSDTIDAATEAIISVETGMGKIVLTAQKQPASTIKAAMKVRI